MAIRPKKFTMQVEAVRVTPGNLAQVAEWCEGVAMNTYVFLSATPSSRAGKGDWIVKDPLGYTRAFTNEQFNQHFKCDE